MPINFEKKCIFVHIPKTGGISVLKQLKFKRSPYTLWDDELLLAEGKGVPTPTITNSGRLQHLPATLVKILRPDIFDSYYKFSVVRNPYTKILSEFSWKYKFEFNSEAKTYSDQDHKILFDRFLYKIEMGKLKTMRVYSQHKYLYDDLGNLMVDDIIRFENFEEDCKKIFKKMGVECEKIIHKNKAKVELNKNLLLDEKNKERIYNLYKIDFDTFGYQK